MCIPDASSSCFEILIVLQAERNRGIMAGMEGVGMVWTVAEDTESREIVSVMRTCKIEDALAEPLTLTTTVAFGGQDQMKFYDAIKKAHREQMGSRPHYCELISLSVVRSSRRRGESGLYTMATHPDRQGRGAARVLLEYLVNIVDGEGYPVYLQAMPGPVEIYRRFGWVETGMVEPLPKGAALDSETVVLTMMVREPQVRVV